MYIYVHSMKGTWVLSGLFFMFSNLVDRFYATIFVSYWHIYNEAKAKNGLRIGWPLIKF